MRKEGIVTSRQRCAAWIWIALIVATCVCPPWHQGNSSRGYALIFAPPYATVDLSRLVLEWVAISALLAGLYFFWPAAPRPRRFNFLRVHLSRRATIGLITTVAVAACVCAAWGLSRISRSLPAEELLQLDGLCSSSSGTFSGEIHNGSHAWTIREVTIRLTLKEKVVLDEEELARKYGAVVTEAPPDAKPDAVLTSLPQMKSRDYKIQNLWIEPLETGHISVEVLTPPGSEFVQWKPIAVKGFKNFWPGTEKIGAVPPVPSATTAPALPDPDAWLKKQAPASSSSTPPPPPAAQEPDDGLEALFRKAPPAKEPDDLDKVLDKVLGQAPPAKGPKSGEGAQRIQPIPPLPKGYTFAEQLPQSIKDAEKSGVVRTSFRNPEGSSSGDSVLLIVVKIGGPDRLVLTIPPGLLLKSPLPASQDMIIAGLKGRDLGGGKYTPASTITLADNQRARYVIEAYCAEFHKDNPPADKFDFGVGVPVEPGMVCVLDEARHQKLSVAGTQAAIWIRAEHVTFSEMNTRMSIGSTEWSRAEAVASHCRWRNLGLEVPLADKKRPE